MQYVFLGATFERNRSTAFPDLRRALREEGAVAPSASRGAAIIDRGRGRDSRLHLPRRVAEMGLGVTALLRGRRSQIYPHDLSRRFHA